MFVDARAVLNKSPLQMENCKIKATALITLIENGTPIRSHAIIVTGFASNTKSDDLELLFENRKASGGGDLKGKVFINPNCTEAVIAFAELNG